MLSRSLLMRIAIWWTVAIVVGSFLPIEVKEAIRTETHSAMPAVRRRAAIRHRAGHMIAFGIASFLFAAGSVKRTQRLYYFLFIAALGSTIEYMQHAIYGSVFEWWDIRDDVLAAAYSVRFSPSVLSLARPQASESQFFTNKVFYKQMEQGHGRLGFRVIGVKRPCSLRFSP